MSNQTKFATCLSTLAAIALVPGGAGAALPPGSIPDSDGYVQLRRSAAGSASTTIGDYEFGIGYSASFGIEGYNWDVAPNLIGESCVSFEVDLGPITVTIVQSTCPTLPGTRLSSSITSTSTTYGGYPALRKVTTELWNVPDAGALARVDGSFRVPATLFDQDFDLFKLTASGVGDSNGADTVNASAFVLGAKVMDRTFALPVSAKILDRDGTIAQTEAVYVVFGIPITVSGTVAGSLEVLASASFNQRTLAGTLTPRAIVDASFGVSIGAGGDVLSAEAGVLGNLTVIDASLPVSLSAAIGAGGITVSESAHLTMTGLDGDLSLYAEACFLGGCVDTDLELFSWTGLTYADTTIFSASQSIDF